MSDVTNNEFTHEQLLQQAQGNATALALTSIAYVKGQDLPIDEYVAFVGRQYARGWEQLRGQPVKALARIAALNMVSVGGTLRTLSGDDTRAEVLIVGWPADEILTEFGLTQQDSDAFWTIFHPIMDYLGIRYGWQRQDDGVLMTFAREHTT